MQIMRYPALLNDRLGGHMMGAGNGFHLRCAQQDKRCTREEARSFTRVHQEMGSNFWQMPLQ